jgi:hypothetical protein
MQLNTERFKLRTLPLMLYKSATQAQYLSAGFHQFHSGITRLGQTTYYLRVDALATAVDYPFKHSCADCTTSNILRVPLLILLQQ